MTSGHRHRAKLNRLALELEERAKPWQRAEFAVGILCGIGFLLSFLNGASSALGSSTDFAPFGFAFGFTGCMGMIFLVVAGVESKLTDLAIRLRVETIYEKLRRDGRPPVLYLRSFVRDTEASKIYRTVTTWPGRAQPQRQVEMVATTTGSEEDLLVKLFDQIGPVIAIGNPADTTPLIGAARYYADALRKNWKEVVETLICKASIVILHAGHTEGFLWELKPSFAKSHQSGYYC